MGNHTDLGSLYQTLILEHYRRPRNHGALEDAHARVHLRNQTCGDEIELSLKLDGDRVEAIRFAGQGCSISQASASMMTDLLAGKSAADAGALAERFREMLRRGSADPGDRALGDLRALAGVARFPARMRCALLAWNAFDEAMRGRDV